MAKACGCETVVECKAEDTAYALRSALKSGRMTVIVSKCKSGNVPVGTIDIDAPVIKHRFMEAVRGKG